jgi:hypothetical protein
VAKLKTHATTGSVEAFLDAIDDDQRREDCRVVAAMMEKATKSRPVMWGPSIVGFGDYEYVGSTGKSTKWFLAGFSPRKQALTLYLMGGYPRSGELMDRLGKHSTGQSCLYIKKLDDIHLPTLRGLIAQSLEVLRKARRR